MEVIQVTREISSSSSKECVKTYKELHPNNQNSPYHTVYSLHLKFIESDGSDCEALIRGHLGDYDFKNIIKQLDSKSHSGIRIYHAARKKRNRLQLFNYAVFTKNDTVDGNGEYPDDYGKIFEIDNHFFDLRVFSVEKGTSFMGHTTCNPVCYSGSNDYLG